MKRSFHSLTIGSSLVLFTVAIGCTPSHDVTPGAPTLVAFSVVLPGGGSAATLATEAGAPIPVPPASYAFALFDRILDPTTLETVDADAGITPKLGVATVEWSGGLIDATTLYIPNGHYKWTLIPAGFYGMPFGVGPSITIKPTLGLPAGTTVTVTLNPTKVRSHDQKNGFVAATDVTSPLVFDTEPLGVAFDNPQPAPSDAAVDNTDGGDAGAPPPDVTPPVMPDFVLHVAFNDVMTPATGPAINVSTTVGGVPVAGFAPVVAVNKDNPTIWNVSPPAQPWPAGAAVTHMGWPAGATVTVKVPAAVADYFGDTLGADATATFTVAQ